MVTFPLERAVRTFAALLVVVAFVWPAAALVIVCVDQGVPPTNGFSFSPRQLSLLGRSFWLAACGTGAAVLFALPVAFVLGRGGRIGAARRGGFIVGLLMANLLCPPMVYAFGWEARWLSGLVPDLDARIRCIAVWALWTWPIPALLIGAGFSRTGRSAFEAALLSASAPVAFLRISVPLLARFLAVAALIVFILLFNDYGIPHACGLIVYATDLLGWAQSSALTIDTVWPALPGTIVTVVTVVALLMLGRSVLNQTGGDDAGLVSTAGRSRLGAGAVVTICFLVSCALPITGLIGRMKSADALYEAIRVYGHDLAWSVGTAWLAAMAVIGLAGVSWHRVRVGTAAMAIMLVFGALPGALIGEALVAAYNRSATAWLYDHWPIVALAYVARFGWIGAVIAVTLSARGSSDLRDAARVDGAGEWQYLTHVLWPLHWPLLLAGIGVVTALSVADVAASAMVRVPSFAPIAHVLIEKFHRFETGMLVALSLWLIGLAILAAVLGAIALRRLSGLYSTAVAPTKGAAKVSS